jgi:hypothetical protein
MRGPGPKWHAKRANTAVSAPPAAATARGHVFRYRQGQRVTSPVGLPFRHPWRIFSEWIAKMSSQAVTSEDPKSPSSLFHHALPTAFLIPGLGVTVAWTTLLGYGLARHHHGYGWVRTFRNGHDPDVGAAPPHFLCGEGPNAEQERRIGRSLMNYGTPASACGIVSAIFCSKQACRCGYDCRPRRRRLLLPIFWAASFEPKRNILRPRPQVTLLPLSRLRSLPLLNSRPLNLTMSVIVATGIARSGFA